MNKTILTKLAFERCGFYLSQLLAHVHLADMASLMSQSDKHDESVLPEEACIYTIISALRSDLEILETLIEE